MVWCLSIITNIKGGNCSENRLEARETQLFSYPSLVQILKIFEKNTLKLNIYTIRNYKILPANKFIYDLQFGFRENNSSVHALINLMENVRQALGKGYIGW